MKHLLDTNIISDLIRRPNGPVAARIMAGETICTSIIVAAELRFGAAKRGSAQLSDRVEQALLRMQVLPFTRPADQIYGALRTDLEHRGQVISGNDMLIAAHALSENCVLVTDNVGEFARIEGLTVLNWLR